MPLFYPFKALYNRIKTPNPHLSPKYQNLSPFTRFTPSPVPITTPPAPAPAPVHPLLITTPLAPAPAPVHPLTPSDHHTSGTSSRSGSPLTPSRSPPLRHQLPLRFTPLPPPDHHPPGTSSRSGSPQLPLLITTYPAPPNPELLTHTPDFFPFAPYPSGTGIFIPIQAIAPNSGYHRYLQFKQVLFTLFAPNWPNNNPNNENIKANGSIIIKPKQPFPKL